MERMTQTGAAVANLPEVLALPPRKAMNADQEKLASRIERQIRRQTNDKVRELRVVVLDESITLQGRCGTFYCKQLAQHAAMHLAVDAPVVNQIDVW